VFKFSGNKYMDKNCRFYESREESNNMLMPQDRTHIPFTESGDDGRVVLEMEETHTNNLLERIVAVVIGMTLAVTGMVTFFAPRPLTDPGASAVQYSLFALAVFTLIS
jgi:hypothetical protein